MLPSRPDFGLRELVLQSVYATRPDPVLYSCELETLRGGSLRADHEAYRRFGRETRPDRTADVDVSGNSEYLRAVYSIRGYSYGILSITPPLSPDDGLERLWRGVNAEDQNTDDPL